MSNCITNNQSKYVKENKPQQLINLYTKRLKGILVKCHLIKRVSRVNPNMTQIC